MVNIADYYYDLPEELIAQSPAVPRDSSRLFVYNTQTDKIIFDQFNNLPQYLPSNSFLVMNETKVLPSRITLHKSTGGKVRVLFLVNEQGKDKNLIRLFVDRKVSVGDELFFASREKIVITAQNEQLFTAQFSFSRNHLYNLLKQEGCMPIPLYIKHSPLNESQLRERYQTIFARAPNGARFGGSAAAPTASLHFTDRLFRQLDEKHIPRYFVTLHVGMGTFAPISETNIKEKKLHNEWYEISNKTLRCIDTSKKEAKELVAVGTTVVRTLESVEISPLRGQLKSVESVVGKTNLFIYPPYEFKMVDHMITNFHLPQSSLMMLVQAFLLCKGARRNLGDLYKIAIKEKFRFYSFGDAMLLL